MSDRRMKFMIAGLGSIGRRHLRHLKALGQDNLLLYRTHRSTLPDDELAGIPVETDLQAALAHKPDAVIVSNPTALHLDVAIPAAEAGCHILLEKPVSHSLEGLDKLKRAAQKSGVRILVGFQFRYHPGLRRIAELLQTELVGRPVSFRAHWGEYLPAWHPWEDYRASYSARRDLGGGVILTLTHPLDYLHWLLGAVQEVWSFAGQYTDLELDVVDTAEIGLRFGSGVVGSVHLNYTQRPPRHQLEIVCTEGTLRWDNAGTALEVYRAETTFWEQHPLPVGFQRDDLFSAQMKHFLQVVEGTAAPFCTLDDGIAALELALAAHQSAEEKRLVLLGK
ncbi:MAG: Gfo/Idh/MocA family oxidoreductase [Anaerolineales bacterium]|nr:Gfo/Idh/MocA family oxidoreductase [Anaerolineales bacterium]